LATISPEALEGDNVDFFDAKSWTNYIRGNGPSPFQSLITGSSRVSGLTQYLSPSNFDNVVEFQLLPGGVIRGKLVLKANQEETRNNKRIFRFERGYFLLEFVWGSRVSIPYPVPFRLLGDRAVGWLDTIGYDEKSGYRAAVGNKGTKFIFRREDGHGDEAMEDVKLADAWYDLSRKGETPEEESEFNKALLDNHEKRAVILCPQQFGGKPGDYTELSNLLRERGHAVYTSKLSALDWLSITKSAFTKAYWNGALEPSKALPFYNNAINDAISRMDKDHLDRKKEFTILSHSIGGWVARAWLGEVATQSVRDRCKAFVSLGTPHAAPPKDSIVSKLDQTRGLLSYVNDRWPGGYYPDIVYTCVASREVKGKLDVSNVDSTLAFASYFALIGDGNVEGDGITPVKAALLEDSADDQKNDNVKSIILDGVYHADVLPNPIGARNTRLVGCKWYADKLDDWAHVL